MNNKIRAAEKLADIDGNSSQLKQLEKKLEKLKKKPRSHQVRTLYEWECMLRVGSLRRGYISVKSNPAWYLREELIEDCISRGVAVAGTVDAARDVDCPPKMGKVSDIVPLNVCVVYMTEGLSLRRKRRRILMIGSLTCFGLIILPFF